MKEWARRLGLGAVEIHGSLPSTNDRARSWARDGAGPLSLVVAEEQTAGRGRGGRTWLSPPGDGVWLSLLLSSRGIAVDSLLSLRTGLGVARRLEALSGRPVGLKWPNDIFLGPGKAGGILCETVQGSVGGAMVIVGVGVNLVPPPVQADYPVAGFAPLEGTAVMEAVVEGILDAAAHEEETLFPREAEAWRERDLLTGRRVRVEEGATGRVRGIDARGHLLLETETGRRAVSAGAVRVIQGEDHNLPGD